MDVSRAGSYIGCKGLISGRLVLEEEGSLLCVCPRGRGICRFAIDENNQYDDSKIKMVEIDSTIRERRVNEAVLMLNRSSGIGGIGWGVDKQALGSRWSTYVENALKGELEVPEVVSETQR